MNDTAHTGESEESMQVVRKRLLAATLAPALILGLVISELPLTGEHHSALAAVNLGCKGSLTISPSTSGTFSAPGRPMSSH